MNKIITTLLLILMVSCSQDDIPAEKETDINIGNNEETVILEPNNMKYSLDNLIYYVNRPISPNLLSFDGDKEDITFSVIPALPTGLDIDPDTGRIYGTPTVLKSKNYYTIKAENQHGVGTITIAIDIVIPPPQSVTYDGLSEAILFNNLDIPEVYIPEVDGVVNSYSIDPELPRGLSFNEDTGVITGKPLVLKERTPYVIKAINSTGFTEFNFYLRVIDVAPENLQYNVIEATYMVNQEINDNEPSFSGGVPTLFISEPINLPPGLYLDALTGKIRGVPLSEIADFIEYRITAINTGGESSTIIKIKVEDISPAEPVYSDNPINYTKGVTISNNILECAGDYYSFITCPDGKPTFVQIQPILPEGLNYDNYTGVISGTPIDLSPLKDYTVLVSNTGGTKLSTISLGVVDQKPLNLRYQKENYSIRKNEYFETVTPFNEGGPVIDYVLVGELPEGLFFNSSTGVISGIPSKVNDSVTLTVKGINSGGSDSFDIEVEVLPVPYYAFSYRLIKKDLVNGNVEYSFELKNLSIEFDDSKGISLAMPFSVESGDFNIISNTNPVQSDCLQYNNEDKPFEYLETCIVKFSYVAPSSLPEEIQVNFVASTVLNKTINLINYIDISPKNLELSSERKNIVKAITDIVSFPVNQNYPAFFETNIPIASSLREPGYLTNQNHSASFTSEIFEGQDLLSVNIDPDGDTSEGNYVFNNLDFINTFSLTGEYESYTPVCEIKIPYTGLSDCMEGDFSINSLDLTESGNFQVKITLEEGLSSEVGESSIIPVDVYKIKRIINTALPPRRMELYNNKIYFPGLMDSTSTNTRKMLSYSPFSGEVRQVSKFLGFGDDRAFPFAQQEGFLFLKGRDPIQKKVTFFIYDELLDKISPLYNENVIESLDNLDDIVSFKYRDRVYFPIQNGADSYWVYYEKISNTFSKMFNPIIISTNPQNGDVDPKGFVSYNNKLFFYSYVFNDNRNGGGYRLQSIDDTTGIHRLVSNINLNKDDNLTNGVVYDNKIFYISRLPTEPTQSFLVYYDEVSDPDGEFTVVFNAESTGEGEILGNAYGKLFFTLPDSDRDSIYYFDGASREIKKIYSAQNEGSKIRKINKFSNLENKQTVYFIEEQSGTLKSDLFKIAQKIPTFEIKKILDGQSLFIDKDISMFNYNNTLFFSCDQELESLCTYNEENEVISKIADGLNLYLEEQPLSKPKGVILFNNRIFFSSDATSTGQKSGVFELCLKGSDGCLDNL